MGWGNQATSYQADSSAGRLVHGAGILYGVALHRKYHMLAARGFQRRTCGGPPFHDTVVSRVFAGIETRAPAKRNRPTGLLNLMLAFEDLQSGAARPRG